MFKTLLCQPTWFQMYVLYTIWKYTWSALILTNFFISKSKIPFLPIYEQMDLKTAIVMVGKVFIHFPLYLVWPYDFFDSELFPQNFVWQLNNDRKSLDLYYECLK